MSKAIAKAGNRSMPYTNRGSPRSEAQLSLGLVSPEGLHVGLLLSRLPKSSGSQNQTNATETAKMINVAVIAQILSGARSYA